MIINWKQDGPLLHRAEWMNMRLVLSWDRDAWRCWVNGSRTKQRYGSVEAAKAGVDAVVLKLLSNGPIVPAELERPKLTMQGLASVMASMAIVRLQHAAEDLLGDQGKQVEEKYGASKIEAALPRLRTFSSQGSRSGHAVSGAEVERA